MLTVFGLPKAFRGHFGVIQRNAITSWTRLSPRPEIILFGNEEGTAEIARELSLRHVPDVRTNDYGTPLLDDLFQKAQTLATYNTLCYVNADILLLSDFTSAVDRVASWRDRFLMVGRRTELDVDRLQDFDAPDWEARLRRLAREKGRVGGVGGIDYFVFSRGLFPSIPPFAIGRMAWDMWLVRNARLAKSPVVDASAVVLTIHQDHDYSHHPEGAAWITQGKEAVKNRELVGSKPGYTIDYATHKLTPTAIKWDAWRAVWRLCIPVLRISLPVRHRLGLRRDTLAALMARNRTTRS